VSYFDRGIDSSVWLCRGYARDMCGQHFWGFPLYSLDLFGIFTLPPVAIRDFHFTASWTEKGRYFQSFNQYQQPNFRDRSDKKYIPHFFFCVIQALL